MNDYNVFKPKNYKKYDEKPRDNCAEMAWGSKLSIVHPEFDKTDSVSESKDEYWEEYGNKPPIPEPEHDLWLAILNQSLWDYKNGVDKHILNKNFHDALDWFFNESTEDVGSFKFVCGVLGLSNTSIAKDLIKYTKERKAA